MALELKQQLKLSQQLIMTPQLQMAIKLLQLSRLELMETIRQELEENPALEEIQETAGEAGEPGEEAPKTEAPVMEAVTIKERLTEDMDWSNYIDEYNAPGRINFETESHETPGFEPFLSRPTSLQDHLLWQLLMTAPDPETEGIGSLIAGNLNSDGYLETSTAELAETAGSDESTVARVLALMQTFDPLGVCARDLTECLMIQLRHLGMDKTLAGDILCDHLHHLENKNYKAICKALKVSVEDVGRAINVIRSLEPRPGRQFAEDTAQYITPDIYVHKLGDEYVIMLNDDGLPKLRVNSFYRNAIRRGAEIPANAKDYVQDKMRSAAWLIRSIHQRQKTIYRVMESILRFQREFFDRGIAHLRPMVLRDVAEDIGMHESTISRVTTNKYAHTPRGIFELKYFFNSSIRRVHGEAIASASVQDKIRHIIEGEDHRRPYSDDKIAKLLKAQNIDIARRTVAKYREILRVLPSSKRKQI
jgi:RNA polymerase sigma-54 factor